MLKGEQMMRILVDADACPVIGIVERIAKAHGIPVTLLCDTNHVLKSDYSDVKVISAGADAVDFALINLCERADVVVTQDYGVAALALGKGAFAICQSGMLYTQDNIIRCLWSDILREKPEWAKESIISKVRRSEPGKKTRRLKKRLRTFLAAWIIEKCEM